MKSAADLDAALAALHERTGDTPLFNPVFQLAHDISRAMEAGEVRLDSVRDWVADLECDALEVRAKRLHRLVAPVAIDANRAAFRALVEASADHGFDAFARVWERPLLHAVFTAHPTFLLTPDQGQAVADAASRDGGPDDRVCIPAAPRPPITLDREHDEALAAITAAGIARDTCVETILSVAAERFPGRWQRLRPMPYRLATWVGYDMDGRTDIGWTTSIAYRLDEKARRLAQYHDRLAAIDGVSPVLATLAAARDHAADLAQRFRSDLSDPADLSAVANAFSGDHPGRLTSLEPVILQLAAAAATADAPTAIALHGLIAAMRADGLGMGWIHFRVNASQLHNAIRRRIDPDNTLDMGSGTALLRIRALLDDVRPVRSNVGALAIETSTALRQFLAMAQILSHIDADTPIRLLIAECEDAQTVLAAVYFAELFGIGDRVDVSPLFETESAMEHGGRFLESLAAEPAYQSYVRGRGRFAIQTGFSDAGRFVGQIPAALAIERLHGRLAGAMRRHGLTDVAALIFNTHGESMGRGAHPVSVDHRLHHPMSRWARARFADAGIATELEASFQGGDGYLWFRTPELALATLVRIAEVERAAQRAGDDPFYVRTDLSLDFYRGIRRVQREHRESATYSRAITAFGLGLLNDTGSRKSRRQSDLSADRGMDLRQIRAIPHNAILQQLGYPVNLIAGVGTAAGDDLEPVADMLAASDRGRSLLSLLRASNGLASIKTVAAFGELFNSAYWASRPYRGTEPHLEPACLTLAERLTKDDRAGVFRRLASRLRVDALRLHRLLALVPDEHPDPDREARRRALGVLQALRLALLQGMFLRVVQIPPFSRANDISRDDVIEMVFTLRIDDALAQLRRAYPVAAPSLDDFALDAPTDYPEDDAQGYAAIRTAFIDPIEDAYALVLRIGTAISNHFGAHG